MPPTPDTAAVAQTLAQVNTALDQGDPGMALALLEPLKDFEGDAQLLACRIEALGMQREFDAAETAVARAAVLHPQEAVIMHAAGLNAFYRRDYPLAEQRLRAAIRIKHSDARVHNDLGMILEHMNQEQAARDSYAEAIRHQPELASAYRNLGRLAERGGRLEEARLLYQQGGERTAGSVMFAQLLAGIGQNYTDLAATIQADASSPEHFLATEIGQAALAHLPADRKPVVLDLICGPGTVGAMLSRRAGLMIGVDPRVPMLQAAQAQNIYFDLKQQYPSDYLRACKRGVTEVITSNCGLTNLSDLLQLFIDLYVVLSPGGLLVMAYPTQSDSIGWHVEGGGGFSHDPRYVLERADFEGLVLKERRDYSAATHPQVDRTYSLMVFGKPE